MSELNWIDVGAGKLTLRGRPGERGIAALPETGCQRVVTLLSEHENGLIVGRAVIRAGLSWTWLPLPNGQYPQPAEHHMLAAALPILSSYLDSGEWVMIHCAAGIHRTGMVVYGLLRWRGLTSEQALAQIGQMRQHTRNGLQPKQIAWGDALVSKRDS